jgi:hypothetical protein
MEQLAKSGVPSLITNPQCAYNEVGITDTNNILTRNTAATALGDLGTDCAIDAGTSGHLASWALRAYPNRLELQNCEAIAYYKGDASLYKIDVVQNSAVVASTQLTNAANGQLVSLNFPCGSDNSQLITLEVEATSASAAAINFIWLHAGEATNIGDAAQAEVVVRAVGNNSTQSIGDATDIKVTNWSEVTDVYGEFSSNTFTAKRAGNYLISTQVRFSALTSPVRCLLNVYKNGSTVHIAGQGDTSPCVPQNNVNVSLNVGDTIEIYAFQDSSGAVNIDGSATAQWLQITRFPTASEQVVRVGAPGLDKTSWTPTGSWVANTTYTGWYQCDAGNLRGMVQVATSGAPTSTRLTVNLPAGFTIDSSLIGNSRLHIGEATILDAGTRVIPGFVWVESNALTALSVTFIQTISGTNPVVTEDVDVTQSAPMTFASGDQVKFYFTVPVTASSPCPRTPMPLLSQAVTTSSAGVERVERATVASVCSGSPCTITTQSGGFSSITRSGTGGYTVNFVAGTFSAPPTCTVTIIYAAFGSFRNINISTAPTTSSFAMTTFHTDAGTPTNQDSAFNIICQGAR